MEDAIKAKLVELRIKQVRIDKALQKHGNAELLNFFSEILPKAMDAERVGFFIVSPDDDNIWLQSGTYLDERQITVPAADSIVGRVISSGEWVIETGLQDMVGAHDHIGIQTGFSVRNLLCVPVKGVTRGKVTGAIQVLNKNRRQEFTDEDRQLLERLAFVLQVNIENIYLRQELQKLAEQLAGQIQMLEEKLKTVQAKVAS